MLKEIYEQPKALRDTMTSRLDAEAKTIGFPELNWTAEELREINKIFIVACGTAYHAGIVGKYYLEQLARVPVEVDIASEFRYRDPLVDGNSLTIVISQSGETSDTLAALREAKRLGSRTLAVTNVVGSSIAREADQVVYTYAGPEICRGIYQGLYHTASGNADAGNLCRPSARQHEFRARAGSGAEAWPLHQILLTLGTHAAAQTAYINCQHQHCQKLCGISLW